jgi:hypothetical protein
MGNGENSATYALGGTEVLGQIDANRENGRRLPLPGKSMRFGEMQL